MTLVDLPEETKQEMRSAALPLYGKIREIVGDDELINLYCINNPACFIEDSEKDMLKKDEMF